MPINGNKLIKEMTKNLPKDSNIQVWVGAWRKGVSWNHAKLIAVDGRYLHTGGHNMWDRHYLGKDPVHDLSLEMEGRIAHDGHLYANTQWDHIKHKQNNLLGYIADKIPDNLPLLWHNRVIISEYPIGKATWWAPRYNPNLVPRYENPEGVSPVLSIGRLGTLTYKHRPADDAVIAMIDSAKTIIHLALQDLGPVCIPNTKVALPGTTWPKPYLNALARAIWEREVDVEIVLSNPGSMPDGLGPLDACYGNGWSCVDVAAEIIKRIKKQFPNADDAGLRKKVEENLRICFIRHAKTNKYKSGMTIGNHTKHFIIDGIASYTGSQNLYVCDLAEWGVVIDDPAVTKKIMDDFWHPLWQASYTGEDCDVNAVMDGLKIERDGEPVNAFTLDGRNKLEQAAAGNAHRSAEHGMYSVEITADIEKTASEDTVKSETVSETVQVDDEAAKEVTEPNFKVVNDVAPSTGIVCCA
jgi:phosphatidylserine/phosphatidylglycerophosphate/cardiolipin synthase-like enzyme